MTKFRDDFPGKEWCQHCDNAPAVTSVEIPDLGLDLSGLIASIEVCNECYIKIRASLENEIKGKD